MTAKEVLQLLLLSES